jgi:hypothetical protein
VIRKNLIPIVVAALLVVGCSRRISSPPRPSGVPADAVWAGGADGGSFIKCAFDSATGLDLCSVFNDYTGETEARGRYRVDGKSRAQDAGQFAYSAFDGKKIYLKDGSVLSPSPDKR